MKFKQTVFIIIRFIVGIGLLIILFWKVGTIEILSNLKNIAPNYILVAITLFVLAVLIISFRWKLLLAAHGIAIPFHKTVAYYLIGFYFNNFLPTVVGLDIIRAIYASNDYGKKAECFASIVSEKAIGLLAILLIGVFFLPLFIMRDRFILIIFLALLSFAILFLAGIFFFPHRKRLRGFSWLFRMRILLKLKDKMQNLYDAIHYYKNKKRVVFQVLLLSFIYQLTLITIFFLIGRALQLIVPYYYFLAFIPVINIGSMIPITPNGIGIRESLCVYLFGLAGVAPSQSILLSMIYFGIALLISLGGAVLFIVGVKKSVNSDDKK